MARFEPTVAPAGRLCRLGVVVDATDAAWQRAAMLCDRAGLGAVWLADTIAPDTKEWSHDVWADARELRPILTVAALGVMIGMDWRDPAAIAEDAAALPEGRTGPRAELSVTAAQGVDLAVGLRPTIDALPDDRRPRLSALVETIDDARPWLAAADDICLAAWSFDDLEAAADEVRAKALEAGRDPRSLGVGALIPVSIGRTEGEASVRADRDPRFGRLGHPREIGIFGTLEECQDRVIALAHAGVTDVRAILPSSPDIHDVIAQLTAMTIGTTDVLVPGSLRSPAPPPPEGWGGRPERPPRPGISGGSRRR